MDIGDIRGLSTVLCMLAFAAVVFWAFGPSRKHYFEKAADLPFADEAGAAAMSVPKKARRSRDLKHRHGKLSDGTLLKDKDDLK